MKLKIGNKARLTIGAIRDNDGNLITDLASATEVLYMIKNNEDDDDTDAIVAKSKTAGQISVNNPSTGYALVYINSDDTDGLESGDYFHALKIIYSSTEKYEINLMENNEAVNVITLVDNIIKG